MAIKKLFLDHSNKTVSVQESELVNTEAESSGYVSEKKTDRTRYKPNLDFSDPSNFVHFGSAKQYYEDSIAHIYTTYPYDGSRAEKQEWENKASALDLYMLENEYPRTTGHIILNDGAAIDNNVVSGGNTYVLYDDPQYVTFFGGPHENDVEATTLAEIFDETGSANVYDASNNQGSNLALSGVTGTTVEFWAKLPVGAAVSCLFDLWNQTAPAAPQSADYGRLLIEMIPSTSDWFSVSYASGTDGVSRLGVGDSSGTGGYVSGDWNHFAFVFSNSGSQVEVKLYLNGELNDEVLGGTAVSAVEGALQARIGAYIAPPTLALGTAGVVAEWASEGLSIDEFRYWKVERTSKEIGRNWFTQVFGGTNTDDSNTDLGVYYKFNEGIVSNSTVDSTVLDYSGRISNGTIENYVAAIRDTGSAMDESDLVSEEDPEFEDPIIYSSHADVVSLLAEKSGEGEVYDYNNNASLYYTMPGWIIDEDDDGELLKLTQIMSSYLDLLYWQIQELPRLKDSDYEEPHHFIRDVLESAGLTIPDLFVDASIIEDLLSRSEDEIFDEDLQKIKNTIYRNVYNNLIYIYKSKGTEKAFRNMLRCFGVDDELVKINLYGDNVEFKIRDNVRYTTIPKHYVNFFPTDNHEGTVYQYHNAANSQNQSFIQNTTAEQDYSAFTVEAEVLFPKRIPKEHPEYIARDFTESSLFGMHEANPATPANLAWTVADLGNFNVYAVAVEDIQDEDNDVYFVLESDAGFTGGNLQLTSSVYKNVYDNNKWNFAVRLVPTRSDVVDQISGSPNTEYQLEFYGVNTTLDVVEHEFTLTQAVTPAMAQNIMNSAKRLFVGAHIQDFTGNTLMKTDVRVTSFRYWLDYLDNTTIAQHAKDASSYGRVPYRSAYAFQTSPDVVVPQIESLALHWDFSSVSGSDATGRFEATDLTSGSAALRDTDRYSWVSEIAGWQYSGRGENFLPSDTSVISSEHVHTAKRQLPDNLASSDLINVVTQEDDVVFTRDSLPIQHFWAAEKSMYHTISEEMVRMFASVVDFSDAFGQPVDRYRQEYKTIEKLRQLFYEKVQNTPDIEKYIEFYKWIDSSVGYALQQLIPASANFSDDIRNMVENHVLERSKYWNKYPTMEFKTPDVEGSAHGLPELLYSWKYGHAPAGSLTDETNNCLWHAERKERTDASAETLRQRAVREIEGQTQMVSGSESGPRFRTKGGTVYEGSTYAVRRLSKPYRFAADSQEVFPSRQKTVEFMRSVTDFGQQKSIDFMPSGVEEIATPSPTCDDHDSVVTKEKISQTVEESSVGLIKSSLVLPFALYWDHTTDNPYETGQDRDLYAGFDQEPAQGPFTQEHVGGSQHKHICLGDGTDTQATRPELYIDTGTELVGPDQIDVELPRAHYFRLETAKRPLNVRNIKYSTASCVVGNYQEDHEILQTTSRRTNNQYFVRSEGLSPLLSGVASASVRIDYLNDFPLPTRSTAKHVFVERFRAPGGPEVCARGALDYIAEEYSPYNQMNYRNLIVRQHLDTWYSDPYDGSHVFHKAQPNTLYRLVETAGGNVACERVYDNMFISRNIPQSDHQYSWIAASVDPSTTCRYGISSKYPNLNREFDFYTGSHFMNLDVYAAHDGLCGYDSACLVDSSENLTDYENGLDNISSVPSTRLLNAILLQSNGAYGYPSWKQIRVGEKPLARSHRGNNIIAVQDRPEEYDIVSEDGNRFVFRAMRAYTHTNYREPVIAWNKPIDHDLKIVGGDRSFTVRHEYSNNLEGFANVGLTKRLGFVKCGEQTYERLTSAYREGMLDPAPGFRALRYSEYVFPKHANVGLKETRGRRNYAETSLQLAARRTGDLRTYWRDELADRTRPHGSRNAINASFVPKQTYLYLHQDSVWAMDDYECGVTDANGNAMTGSDGRQYRWHILGDLAYVGPERYFDWISVGNTSSVEIIPDCEDFESTWLRGIGHVGQTWTMPNLQREIGNAQGDSVLSGSIQDVYNPFDSPNYYDHGYDDAIPQVMPLEEAETEKSVLYDSGNLAQYQPAWVQQKQIGNVLDYTENASTGSVLGGEHGDDTFLAPYDLDLPSVASEGITSGGLQRYQDSAFDPRPSLQYIYNPFTPDEMLREEGWKWHTGDLSSNKPWFDTYEDYSQDIRLMGQNYSVIPEFRMSQHMDFYINEHGGNFRANNRKFLTLDGANKDKSGIQSLDIERQYTHDIGITYIEDTGILENAAWDDGNDLTAYRGYNDLTFINATFDNSVIGDIDTDISGSSDKTTVIYPSSIPDASLSLNRNNRTSTDLVNDREVLEGEIDIISATGDQILSPREDGVPYSVSFWVKLETGLTDDYVGSYCLSYMVDDDAQAWTGLWLKAGTRGLTYFDTYRTRTDTVALDPFGGTHQVTNAYEFFDDASGTIPTTVNDGLWHHVVVEYLPAGTHIPDGPPGFVIPIDVDPTVRIFVDSIQKFGRHVSDTSNPIGVITIGSGGFGAPQTGDDGIPNLNHLTVGASTPAEIQTQHVFRGFMDEFSLYNGILTSDDVTAVYNNGSPNNVFEMVENAEITGDAVSWITEWSPGLPPQSLVGDLELFAWYRMGVPYTTAFTGDDYVYDEDFFRMYAHTDDLRHYQKIVDDHADFETEKTLTLKVNAVKKLLPYQGFYPSQRTVQVGGLFAECWGSAVKGAPGSFGGQTMQALLQPFYAPGIMFNTIKSGIAVDWPTFNNQSGEEPSEPVVFASGSLTLYSMDTVMPVNDATDTRIWHVKTATIKDTGLEMTFHFYDGDSLDAAGGAGEISDTANRVVRVDRVPEPGVTGSGDTKTMSEFMSDFGSAIDGTLLRLTNSVEEGTDDVGDDYVRLSIESTIPISEDLPITQTSASASLDPPFVIEGLSGGIQYSPTWYDWDSQPKNPDAGLGDLANDTGFLIVDEPSIRIPFEGLISPQTILPASGAIETDASANLVRTTQQNSYVYIQIETQFELAKNNRIVITDPNGNDIEMTIGDSGESVEYNIELDFSSSDAEDVMAAVAAYINLHARSRVNHYWSAEIPDENDKQVKITYLGEDSHLCKISLENTGDDQDDERLGIKYVDADGNVQRRAASYPERQINQEFYGGTAVVKDPITDPEAPIEKPSQIFLLAPEYYTGSVDDIVSYAKYPYFEWTGGYVSPLYELAVHNFLAEVPRFFLKDEELTTFVSKPEREFGQMESGSTYYMDVHLYRSDSFSMTVTPNDGENCNTSNSEDAFVEDRVSTHGRYFGPSFSYKGDGEEYENAGQLIADPCQAPYTPPYFYGKSTARLSFTADETRKYSLDEILSGIDVTNINDDARKLFDSVGGSMNSPAFKGMMTISSSVNLYGRVRDKQIEFALTRDHANGKKFVPEVGRDPDSTDFNRWSIYPKFECPTLNFQTADNRDNLECSDIDDNPQDVTYGRGTGMWSGYGDVPKVGQGVFMSVENSFKQREILEGTGSLLDVCGFENEVSKIGKMAESKEIYEAVVMIPFVDTPNQMTTSVDGRNLFKITPSEYDMQYKNVQNGEDAVEGQQETTISNMVEAMQNYIIPPQLDFSTYSDIPPFVMYIMEFKHVLSRQDLVDLWQGVMPTISKTAEKDVSEITHKLGKHEFFEGRDLPEGVRWMVFKVKRKAEMNYYDLTVDSEDDERFRFKFENDREKKRPNYSYNWPYDFFSMVELIQVEGAVTIENTDEEPVEMKRDLDDVFAPLKRSKKE